MEKAKAKILANKDQLEAIGIEYNITNLIGDVISYYPSGYVKIDIEHEYFGMTFTNQFDIPRHWLEIKEVEHEKI